MSKTSYYPRSLAGYCQAFSDLYRIVQASTAGRWLPTAYLPGSAFVQACEDLRVASSPDVR